MANLKTPGWGALGDARHLVRPGWRNVRKARSRIFVDVGSPEDTVLLAGMARSGTTWVAQVLNYDGTHRILFEPFNPVRVKLAAPFEYIQFMDPASRHEARTAAALRILSGRVRGNWVDMENRSFVFRRRIVKEIRANLMLRWLTGISPRIPLVLMVRHPLAVAASWLQLGWGGPPPDGRSSDFEVMMGQKALLAAFPILGQVAPRIDVRDPLQRIIFQWCVFHLVPFSQFRTGEITVLFYEDLVLHPERETEKLFRHLDQPYDWDRISVAVRRPSATKKTASMDRRQLLAGWQDVLGVDQIRTATVILRMFGLEHLYTSESPSLADPAAFAAFRFAAASHAQ